MVTWCGSSALSAVPRSFPQALGVLFYIVGCALVSGFQEVVLSKSRFLRAFYLDSVSLLQPQQVRLLQTTSLVLRT